MSGGTPGALAQEWGLVRCLWTRELLRAKRERTRWIGAFGQPVLMWIIFGLGFTDVFRIAGAEHVGSVQYFFPGMLALVMLFTTIFATISVVEDRQQGFLQSVLVAPGSRAALVAGKVLGVTTLAAVQIAIFMAFSPLAGFRSREIRWVPLVGICLLACVGLTAMNFTVAWALDSVQAYHAIMGVVLFPLWFLSGAMFPPPDGVLGTLMLLNPMTHAVDGLRASLATDALGVPGVGLPTAFAVLAAYAAAMLALASWTCRRKGA